jgi:GTPase SAR1 family protein
MLVGNKSDLAEESPEQMSVMVETAQQMASKSGMLFIETSAVNGIKVKETFELLLSEINRRRSTNSSKRSIADGKRLQAVERRRTQTAAKRNRLHTASID